MILSDEQIKGLSFFNGKVANYRSIETICKSHLEVNARIRALKAQAQDWLERYVICCEDSKLELEALLDRAERAEAKLRELAEAAEWRDEVTAMALMNFSFYIFNTSSPTKEDWDRATEADRSFRKIKSAAEAAYQAALAEAKQGAADVAPARCSLEKKGRARLRDR